MDPQESRDKAQEIKRYLTELKELCAVYETQNWPQQMIDGDFGSRDSVRSTFPDMYERIIALKQAIESNLPSGYEMGGDLIRHLSWLQICDVADIYLRDVDAELKRIKRFESQLVLVEYVAGLHPKVAVVKTLVLEGNYDAALKAVYSQLEARIRMITKDGAGTSIKASLAKAFKPDGCLKHSREEYNEPARDYLIGVLTYFRSQISHQELPPNRNTLDSCLSLFAVAHEAFLLVDRCEAESGSQEI